MYGPYNAPPMSRNRFSEGKFFVTKTGIPPKLPETTNLVSTNNKKDHSEIKAIKTRTKAENKIPPL